MHGIGRCPGRAFFAESFGVGVGDLQRAEWALTLQNSHDHGLAAQAVHEHPLSLQEVLHGRGKAWPAAIHQVRCARAITLVERDSSIGHAIEKML